MFLMSSMCILKTCMAAAKLTLSYITFFIMDVNLFSSILHRIKQAERYFMSESS